MDLFQLLVKKMLNKSAGVSCSSISSKQSSVVGNSNHDQVMSSIGNDYDDVILIYDIGHVGVYNYDIDTYIHEHLSINGYLYEYMSFVGGDKITKDIDGTAMYNYMSKVSIVG